VGAKTSKTHTYICIQYGSKLLKLDEEEIVADILSVKVVLKVVSVVMVSLRQ
jgi:hypothetical protein